VNVTRWYRAYEGTVTDPKLAEAAMLAGVSRSTAISAWHALLESAAAANDGGRFTTSARRVAVILSEPLDPITALFDAYSELGLIASSAIVAWSKRQYESDSSTPRVKKHRENKKRNGGETLHGVPVTPPKTETETEGSEASASDGAPSLPAPAPPTAIDLKDAVFATGVRILTAAGLSDRNARTMLGRWRKQCRDRGVGDGVVLDALSAAETQRPSDPVAWITAAIGARYGQRPANDTRAIRGSRPDPALDLYRLATAAEEEGCPGGGGEDRERIGFQVPAVEPGRS
jgi:hypothetical protein